MTLLWILTALMSASIVLDVETTLAVLHEDGFETNAIMAWVLKMARNSRFPVYCFQVAVQFGLVGGLLKLLGVLPAEILCVIAAGVHAYCGVQNWRLLKKG